MQMNRRTSSLQLRLSILAGREPYDPVLVYPEFALAGEPSREETSNNGVQYDLPYGERLMEWTIAGLKMTWFLSFATLLRDANKKDQAISLKTHGNKNDSFTQYSHQHV